MKALRIAWAVLTTGGFALIVLRAWMFYCDDRPLPQDTTWLLFLWAFVGSGQYATDCWDKVFGDPQ